MADFGVRQIKKAAEVNIEVHKIRKGTSTERALQCFFIGRDPTITISGYVRDLGQVYNTHLTIENADIGKFVVKFSQSAGLLRALGDRYATEHQQGLAKAIYESEFPDKPINIVLIADNKEKKETVYKITEGPSLWGTEVPVQEHGLDLKALFGEGAILFRRRGARNIEYIVHTISRLDPTIKHFWFVGDKYNEGNYLQLTGPHEGLSIPHLEFVVRGTKKEILMHAANYDMAISESFESSRNQS